MSVKRARGLRQSNLLGWKQTQGARLVLPPSRLTGERTEFAAEPPRPEKRRRESADEHDRANKKVSAPLALCFLGKRGRKWEDISLPSGPLILLRDELGGNRTSRKSLVETLRSLPNWDENIKFTIYGKECTMKRRICQFSSTGDLYYSYSGLKAKAAPRFPSILYDIKCDVEDLFCDFILGQLSKAGSADGSKTKHMSVSRELEDLVMSRKNNSTEIFNYCLCNHYRSGDEKMGWHSDDEASLDKSAPIASVSFGVSRNFDIRLRKKDGERRSRVKRISLGDGDLLVMLPPMQQHYQHAIPEEKRVAGERINLTFRRLAG